MNPPVKVSQNSDPLTELSSLHAFNAWVHTSSSGQHSVCRQSAHILKIPPTPNFAWKHGRSGREEAIASGGEAAMAKAGGALLPGRAGLGTRLTRAFPLFKTPDSPKTLSLHQSVFVFHSMLVECWPELLV